MDSGGNAESQAATLMMVRALATGDVQGRDCFHLLRGELAVALAMDTTMGAAVSLVGIFRAPEVTVVVAITMVLIVVAGSVIGISLPFCVHAGGLGSGHCQRAAHHVARRYIGRHDLLLRRVVVPWPRAAVVGAWRGAVRRPGRAGARCRILPDQNTSGRTSR
jgi:hypothetical protein